jgi:plastocyanin
MTDWDLLTPGIGLTSIGIVGVGISLAGVAKTFVEGMHAVSLLTMFIGMIFLASGLFKDGFPSTGKAKSATFITLGFLVTFGVAAAVTTSIQVPTIFAYIGLMMIISIPATVLAVASYKRTPYIKALAVIFIGAAVIGGASFYVFGLVTPKIPATPANAGNTTTTTAGQTVAQLSPKLSQIIKVSILPGASAQGNPNFDPKNLNVPKGVGIEWTNNDNAPHTVTSSKDVGKSFDSSLIKPKATFTLDTSKLTEKEYDYFCTVHPFMRAKFTIGGAERTTATANSTGSQSAINGTNKQAISATIVKGAATLTNNAYDPANLVAKNGQIIKWTNADNTMHTITSKADQGKSFDSGILKPNAEFTIDASKLAAGDYTYFCTVHPTMSGKLTIKK